MIRCVATLTIIDGRIDKKALYFPRSDELNMITVPSVVPSPPTPRFFKTFHNFVFRRRERPAIKIRASSRRNVPQNDAKVVDLGVSSRGSTGVPASSSAGTGVFGDDGDGIDGRTRPARRRSGGAVVARWGRCVSINRGFGCSCDAGANNI